MKRLSIITIYIFLTVFTVFAQNPKVPVKPPLTKPVQSRTAQNQDTGKVPDANRISDIEWNTVIKAFEAEDWDRVTILSPGSIKKLKTDNEDKQLARLRYFYLYSLAGKVSQGKTTYEELEKIADTFIGQDFLMPSREIAANCVKKLNYICPVTDNNRILRVTTINKAANSILSFEYVRLPEEFDFAANTGKKVFLGGKLQKFELNSDSSTPWVIRLFFENGILLLKDDSHK